MSPCPLSCATHLYAAASPDQLQRIFHDGGLTLKILIGLSMILVAAVVYLWLTLRRETVLPSAFAREAEALARQSDYEGLDALCRGSRSPAAAIVSAGVGQAWHNAGCDPQLVLDAAESEGSRQAGDLYQRLGFILDLAKIAPMIGLLGTVVGMREAFTGIEHDIGVQHSTLASGISKALINTAAGLAVGIMGLFVYSILKGRTHRAVSLLEERSSAIVRSLLSQRKAR